MEHKIGTMIELPRAALRARDIAKRLREKMDLARDRQKKYEAEAPNKDKFNTMLENAATFLYNEISKPKSPLINCPGDMETHDPENYKRWETLINYNNIKFDGVGGSKISPFLSK